MSLWPSGPRAQITRTGDGLIIVIPASSNTLMLVANSVFLVGWAVGAVFIASPITKGGMQSLMEIDESTGNWLIGWMFLGVFAIFNWLWMVRAKEYVRVTPRTLAISHSVWRSGKERKFDTLYMSTLQTVPSKAHPAGDGEGMGYSSADGKLAFNYIDGSEVRFGISLGDAEARELLDKINAVIQQSARVVTPRRE